MPKKIIITLLLFQVLAPVMVQAQTSLQLQSPVGCTLGSDCWIVNHVDVNPADTAQDFMCTNQTYDAHKGTDFGIADLVTMEMGVDVLAAADGKILRIRDGMEDKMVTEEQRLQLLDENKGCGNGVFIDHGNGWQTIYCHLKQDSIAVSEKDTVKAGQKIAQIGHSGIAEFPHLHLGVFFENQVIDPFTGKTDQEGCGAASQSLWQSPTPMDFQPFAIYAGGFTDNAPNFDAIKIDSQAATKLSSGAPGLVFWAGIFGSAENDSIKMTITDPQGRVFAQRAITQDKNRARQFYYVGKKNRDNLKTGTYTAKIDVTRLVNGKNITKSRTNEIQVAP